MSMTEYKRLNESQVEELLLLYIGGRSVRRVAKEMGVDPKTVRWHVDKAGVPIRSRDSYFGPKPLTQSAKKRKARV